jgi:hypothetical protein
MAFDTLSVNRFRSPSRLPADALTACLPGLAAARRSANTHHERLLTAAALGACSVPLIGERTEQAAQTLGKQRTGTPTSCPAGCRRPRPSTCPRLRIHRRTRRRLRAMARPQATDRRRYRVRIVFASTGAIRRRDRIVFASTGAIRRRDRSAERRGNQAYRSGHVSPSRKAERLPHPLDSLGDDLPDGKIKPVPKAPSSRRGLASTHR